MSDVVNLAARTGNNALWSVEQALEDALKDVRSAPGKYTKAVIMLVDTRGDGDFRVGRWIANAKPHEVVAALQMQLFESTKEAIAE
jgi:hypothetical protein